MKNYIIAEGEFDIRLLEMVLPEKLLAKTSIIKSGGYSSALSVAKTLLIKSDNSYSRIIIFIDADTNEESKIKEKIDFIKSYTGYDSRIDLILVKPQTESILFESKKLIERVFERAVTEYELELGKYVPNDILKEIKLSKTSILSYANQDDVKKLSKHKDIKTLIEILEHRPVST